MKYNFSANSSNKIADNFNHICWFEVTLEVVVMTCTMLPQSLSGMLGNLRRWKTDTMV